MEQNNKDDRPVTEHVAVIDKISIPKETISAIPENRFSSGIHFGSSPDL